ncbi:hypothetical protein [Mycobacteroides salmoniphilum]|uniref:Uncharacterized protein n=1 Tax=Mycobacteroides salmoniphilum TaxID=404941 RepID=A0A4R8SLE6_9MYCO|nr:hypothetical protein [Mycobacteroides salmoniphilum]TDZ98551.1 hypothetical protein CCUG60885_00421 [Mycobacteroides salmoniphilum]TEA03081.1 hypothetical protein CCUG60883_03705 [Mycobacteroides salmoniphilum]
MPQELVEQLATQHRLALALLLGEIHAAFDKTVAMLSETFPDIRQVHGGVFCGNVRAFVLAMNGIDALSRRGLSPRKVPEGASCGPGSTLKMWSGPNSSVRIGDSALAWARMRKLKPANVEGLPVLSSQMMPGTRPGVQMALDTGLQAPVLGPEGIGERYDLFVYWWPTADMTSVEGAILAAVADVDTPEEQILAFTLLPPPVRRKTAAELAETDDYEPQGDFEKHMPEQDSGEETGQGA